jgi:membrane protein DedA with SNARE-associated domain
VDELTAFLERNGEAVIFASVFAQQIGVPLPAIPVLLGAGAMAGAGKLDVWVVVALSLAASLPGDLLWYYLGRKRGRRVLATLCRMSLEPDSCVRRTESFFTKHGPASLIVARFVPGLSTVATPLAGVFHVGLARFLAYNLAGAVVWTVAYVGLGYALSDQLEQVAGSVERLGTLVTGLVVGGIVAYVVFKLVERWRIIRMLRVSRIGVDELKRMIDTAEDVFVVDLRSAADAADRPHAIPGALRVDIADLTAAGAAIPRDREIVVYCT